MSAGDPMEICPFCKNTYYIVNGHMCDAKSRLIQFTNRYSYSYGDIKVDKEIEKMSVTELIDELIITMSLPDDSCSSDKKKKILGKIRTRLDEILMLLDGIK